MKPTALWSNIDQNSLLSCIWDQNQLRTRPCALDSLYERGRIEPEARVPILRYHCGLIQLQWVGWTRGRFGCGPAAIYARGKSIGRRCLVPVTAVELKGHLGTTEIRPLAEPFVLIGAVWRPQTENGQDPDTVSLLSTDAPDDWVAYLDKAPVIVRVDRCVDWLDAARDTIPLQEPPSPWGLELSVACKDLAPVAC